MSGELRSEVTVPAIFGNHMVLQADQPIPIWGWAGPNEKVTVRLGKSAVSATAGADGKWSVKLPKLAAGGPYQMTVAGTNTLTLSNILIGEVWVCSGQSNMCTDLGWCDLTRKVAAEAKYPDIRYMDHKPWRACDPEAALGFSGVAYCFAEKIHRELKVPVGMIVRAQSMSSIQVWTPLDRLACQSWERLNSRHGGCGDASWRSPGPTHRSASRSHNPFRG
jgi:sialate O-acetylesterase